MSSADLVYLGVAGFTRSLAPLASRHDRSVWTDLHGYDGANPDREDFIEVAEIVLFSGERLPDPRPTMEQLRGRGKRLVVCTLGKRGALALKGSGRWIEVRAEAADVVDTNGAGDAFAAGLMVASFVGVPSARRWQSPHFRQPSRSRPANSPRPICRSNACSRAVNDDQSRPGPLASAFSDGAVMRASNTTCHAKGARTRRTIAPIPDLVRKCWWTELSG